MNHDICSIPVSEIFEGNGGCPFCRMHRMLDDHAVEFILGPAMMEPDVREETNRRGFCKEHLGRMLAGRKRLPLALILETHLQYMEKNFFPEQPGIFAGAGSAVKKAEKMESGCYVCDRVERDFNHMFTTFFKLWSREPEFRGLLASQKTICLPHYTQLLSRGKTALSKKDFAALREAADAIMRACVRQLHIDVSAFCRMFDYRNEGKDFGRSRDAVERSIRFLSGDEEGKQ